jgi:putative cardiolipin synthase
VHDGFDNYVPKIAYEVRLNAGKQLEWVDRSGAEEVILHEEPATGAIKRGLVTFMSWLPIDWLL